MGRNLYLNIDDDVSRTVAKIKKVSSADLTLVLPKGALLLSSAANAKKLKAQADTIGKNISVITRDEKAVANAASAGFEIKELDYINKAKSPAAKRLKDAAVPKAEQVQNRIEMNEPAQPLEQQRLEQSPGFQQFPVSAEMVSPQMQPQADFQPLTEQFFIEPVVMSQQSSDFFVQPQNQPGQVLIEHPYYPQPKKRNRLLRSVVVITILALILAVTLVLPQASIVVYARTQPISRDLQFAVDKNAKAADAQQLLIPGKLFDSNEEFSSLFNASGQVNVGSKAQGDVQIYNFTGKIIKLGVATTTLTAGDKVYHFVTPVAGIKPTRYFAGTKDVDPASLSSPVQIIADQPGEDYNLAGGTRFEINNQLLGDKPTVLYATNPDPIQNGSTRLRTVVTQTDLDQARKQLTNNLLDSIKQQLLNNQNLMLVDSGSSLSVQAINFDKNVNDQSETFTGTVSGHITALTFDPNILKSLVEQKVSSSLDANQYLLTSKKETLTDQFKSIDLAAGQGIMNVHFESIAAAKIDTEGIASKISGKDQDSLKELLLSDPNIDSVSVSFSPFWVRTVPRLSGRVSVISATN